MSTAAIQLGGHRDMSLPTLGIPATGTPTEVEKRASSLIYLFIYFIYAHFTEQAILGGLQQVKTMNKYLKIIITINDENIWNIFVPFCNALFFSHDFLIWIDQTNFRGSINYSNSGYENYFHKGKGRLSTQSKYF